ncbi:hypothetical protein PMIN03_009253 [Paraphaeosphaeria minitans]
MNPDSMQTVSRLRNLARHYRSSQSNTSMHYHQLEAVVQKQNAIIYHSCRKRISTSVRMQQNMTAPAVIFSEPHPTWLTARNKLLPPCAQNAATMRAVHGVDGNV